MSHSCAMPTLRKPCQSCPWRVDQTAQDIPNFDMILAEKLSSCSPDDNDYGPEYTAQLFACHQSRLGEEFPCAGWLATVGHRHPMVRFSVSLGRIPAEALKPGEDWPDLHPTYQEVLAKLRASVEE